MINRAELEVRELRAHIRVVEAIQTQLLLRLAAGVDQPQEYVRLVMMTAEDSLRGGLQQTEDDDDARQIAEDAVTIFEDYSMRLIAAIMAPQRRQ